MEEPVKLNIISLVVILILVGVFLHQTSNLPWTPHRIVGLAIAAPALLLLVVARLQLGGAFSIRPKASSLVTTGLYARIRNPIYVFGALFIIGLAILIGFPQLILILAVIVPLQVFRSRKEAEVLEAKFGDEYRAYKQKTWF
jgi:protein-S-isoprenylcysteine O-methyltransferase Ste14